MYTQPLYEKGDLVFVDSIYIEECGAGIVLHVEKTEVNDKWPEVDVYTVYCIRQKTIRYFFEHEVYTSK